jgi:NAD(P)-dependent dehydrogenase (short-subunit alcohol dehydrogenase family)
MTDQYPPGYIDGQSNRLLLGRTGDPEELAATLVWLVSDGGAYVTGQSIVVDGGLTIA